MSLGLSSVPVLGSRHARCYGTCLRSIHFAPFQKFGTIRADLIEQMRFKQRLKVIQTLEDTTKRNVVSQPQAWAGWRPAQLLSHSPFIGDS